MSLNESWVVLRRETVKRKHNLELDAEFMSTPKLAKDRIPVPPEVAFRRTFFLRQSSVLQ